MCQLQVTCGEPSTRSHDSDYRTHCYDYGHDSDVRGPLWVLHLGLRDRGCTETLENLKETQPRYVVIFF